MTESLTTLRRGDTGGQVKNLQEGLLNLGYDPEGIDGVFGLKTERAVKNLQADAGLPINGIVGLKTWAVIQWGYKVGPEDLEKFRRQAIVATAEKPTGLWALIRKLWYIPVGVIVMLWVYKT